MAGLFKRIAEKLFTSRKPPKQVTTQARHVRDKKFGGNTKAMAAAYGVDPRTVQRWIDGTRAPQGASKKAVKAARAAGKPVPVSPAEKLEREAAAVQVTDRGRERKAKQFEKEADSPTGVRVRVDRAGSFSIKKSEAVRPQTVELDLTGDQAARLVRATNETDVKSVVGEALADYFNGGGYGGFRAGDFDFDPNGVDLS